MKILGNIREKIGAFSLTSFLGTRQTKFGTFAGVFTPDVLTILGVIMYLRLGWVVGNAGFLGAVVIILMAKTVTICTGLSMASITTNIKIGAGGAYSIISKSLGLEAGGSVGIPFYISQTLSVAFYIIGFTEGWLRIFPAHPPLIISTVAWGILLLISIISARFAIKVQYLIMAIIGLSILSFVFTSAEPRSEIQLVGNFEDADFWRVFAIFFPAVTGIMAGANLSGELKNPRKAIPIGTISAIGVTLVIYIGLAYVAAKHFAPAELRANQMIMADYALWAPIVVMGILAATFSSALASLVGAPRILQALSDYKTVPFHRIFVQKTENNEPRNAIVFTAIVVEIAIIMGNLDALASLLTMFFLITYGTLNLVVFIEQSMNLISFRPTLRIPRFVPLFGAASCVLIMFLINPVFSVIAIVTTILLYIWFTRKGLEIQSGDIRGGMFLMLAEIAAQIAAKFPRQHVSWKPDLLLPIDNPKIWSGSLLFIRSITSPSGSIFAFTIKNREIEKTENELRELLSPLGEENVLVNSTVVEDEEFLHGAKLVMQTLRGGTLRPNVLFLTLGSDTKNDDIIDQLAMEAIKNQLGMVILHQHPRVAFGMQTDVNLWLRDKSPNWNLAVLMALQLQFNWEGKLNLITATTDTKDKRRLYRFLERIGDRARLPSMTEYHVLVGNFKQALETAPRADVNIFGVGTKLDFKFMRSTVKSTKSSCLYVADSGQESAVV